MSNVVVVNEAKVVSMLQRVLDIVYEQKEKVDELVRTAEGARRFPECYTRKEAAEKLKISLPTLNKKIKDGQITPAKRHGRRVLIPTDQVDYFLKNPGGVLWKGINGRSNQVE